MYPNYQQYVPNKPANLQGYSNDDRLVGGFAFPFLLGGVTGAALAPAFWNRPNYYPPYRPYPPYPIYPNSGYPVPIYYR